MSNPPSNMIGQSQSGTGKTAAFVLNILSRIELTPDKANIPQTLVLAPSRELARQIVGVIEVMGQWLDGLKVATAVPQDSNRGQRVEASVVVGTPGTVLDIIKRRLLDTRMMKVLVLDEADNMLDLQGLGDQCIRVKQYDLRTRETYAGLRADFVVDPCQKISKSCYSPPLSPSTSSVTRTSLRQTPTRSP
jgi:ATP-dependent RNA helicase DDX19/DBP5